MTSAAKRGHGLSETRLTSKSQEVKYEKVCGRPDFPDASFPGIR
jgi:hypothetical protein